MNEHTKNEKFYELAWALRLKYIKQMIDGGERHPLRVINKLCAFERFHELSVTNDVAKAGYQPRSENTTEDSETENIQKQGTNVNIKSAKFLPTRVPVFGSKPINEEVHLVPYYHTDGLISFLVDYLSDKQFEAVVELGSGFSKNLFELYYQGGPKVPYYAGEYTQSGLEMTRTLAALTNDFELKAFFFDHKKPDLSPVQETGRVFFFTCHSLEQVEKIPDGYFRSIAAHAEQVTCVHFEPFGYQIKTESKSEADKVHEEFFKIQGWNKNFFFELMKSYLRNDIHVSYVGKNVMGGVYSNPTSLAVWHNRVKKM